MKKKLLPCIFTIIFVMTPLSKNLAGTLKGENLCDKINTSEERIFVLKDLPVQLSKKGAICMVNGHLPATN